jgi:hypothetical protein
MWICPNCKSEIEDKHLHCWNCGSKQAVRQFPKQPSAAVAVPRFTSLETDANLPKVRGWWFRLPGSRIVIYLLMAGVLKVLSSTFFGSYGLYIFIGVAICAMMIILWRFFHHDPTDGVGIKLK